MKLQELREKWKKAAIIDSWQLSAVGVQELLIDIDAALKAEFERGMATGKTAERFSQPPEKHIDQRITNLEQALGQLKTELDARPIPDSYKAGFESAVKALQAEQLSRRIGDIERDIRRIENRPCSPEAIERRIESIENTLGAFHRAWKSWVRE